MSKLTEKIECVDCGGERMITKACLGLVTRCKACQKIFNRNKARERYRKLKGIPLDKPVNNVIKPKKKKEVVEESTSRWVAQPSLESESTPQFTDEEKKIREEKLNKLLDLLPDKSTTEDW